MGRSGKIPRLPILYVMSYVFVPAATYCRRRGGITIADIVSAGFRVRTPARQCVSCAGARVPDTHLRAHN